MNTRGISRQRSASSLSSRGLDREKDQNTSGLLSPYNSRSPLAGFQQSPLTIDAAASQLARPKFLQESSSSSSRRNNNNDIPTKFQGLVLDDIPTLGSSSSLISSLHSDSLSLYPTIHSPQNPNFLSAPSSAGSRRRANTASGPLSPVSPRGSPTESKFANPNNRTILLPPPPRPPASPLPPLPVSNSGPPLPPPPPKSRTTSPTPRSPPHTISQNTTQSTPSSTPTMNSNMYGQRQGTDPSRPYQVPPPPMSPPPSMGGTSNINNIMSNIPPPPPRYPSAPATTVQLPGPPSGLPPPPSGPPPNATAQRNATWSSSYGTNIPPPPPPTQQGPRPYNPQPYTKIVNGQQIAIPPPPPPSEGMSATYIPSGDPYGEGVGIPGLGFPDDTSTWSATSQTSWLGSLGTTSSNDTTITTPVDTYNGTAHNRGNSMTSNATTTSGSGISAELAAQWSLEHVLSWLQAHNFSKDWISTFRALDLHGYKFLELGSSHGGRGNFGMMHQQVYPRLAIECTNSGNRWEQTREREEGKRMRRLIRGIVKGEPSITSHGRKESISNISTVPTSAGPDSGSPDTPIKAPGPGFSVGRRSPQIRSQTMPLFWNDFNNTSNSSDPGGNHRKLLVNIDEDSNRRHSPTTEEVGATNNNKGSGNRSYSPAGSPANALFPSSTTTTAGNTATSPGPRYGSHRTHRNSTDSVSSNAAIYGSGVPDGASQALRSQMTLGDMKDTRRYGHDGGSRPSPLGLDSGSAGDRSAGATSEPPGSAKEGKSFMSIFKRKKHHDDPDSPTSPMQFKPHSLGSRGNSSEPSLERPGSSFSNTQDQHTPASSRSWRIQTGRTFILATLDHWNYRMVDVSDLETSTQLRHSICTSLGLPDAEGAALYITELGKFDHDEALDDSKLMTNKKLRADAAGSLKVFVRPGNMAGVNVHIGQSQLSPAHLPAGARIDEDTYARLNGQRRRSSSSPPTSRQNTLAGEHGKAGTDGEENKDKEKSLAEQSEAYQTELARKQQEYLAKKLQKAGKDNTSPLDGGTTSIVGRSIDFDVPRNSPFEDKKHDTAFAPQRRAPAAPSEMSATLIKANSLSKRGSYQRSSIGSMDGFPTKRPGSGLSESPKPISQDKRKPTNERQALGGIGAAIAGIGRGLGGIAHPGNRPTSPGKSPENGNDSDKGMRRFIYFRRRRLTNLQAHTAARFRTSRLSSHKLLSSREYSMATRPLTKKKTKMMTLMTQTMIFLQYHLPDARPLTKRAKARNQPALLLTNQTPTRALVLFGRTLTATLKMTMKLPI